MEKKQIIVGELPIELYGTVMEGVANHFKKQLKLKNPKIIFDENQTNEEFVKLYIFQSIKTAYKNEEAEKRATEIDNLLK